MSSFKNKNLFGSGPHRFGQGRQGQLIVSSQAIGVFSPQTFAQGLVELEVVVTGRLVAQSEAALWTLRDAIVAELLHPPAPGELIDDHGHAWPDMCFVRFDEADRTDRGREHSLAYVATFRRMVDPFAQI